jgi:superfamily II DNA or RNA helicase
MLRPYQQAALQAVYRDVARGYRRLLLQLATGAGKTIIFSAAIRHWNQPTLIIVHRQELAQQALDKLRTVWPQVDAGLVKGHIRQDHAQVVVSTVQTLAAKPLRRRFTRVIIDEAHHAVSPQWLAVLKRLGYHHPRPDQVLLGVTATTQRLDGIGLHQVFDRLSYRITLPELIQQGYLAPLRGYRIHTQISLDQIAQRHGDYDLPQLSRTIDIPARNAMIVQTFRQFGGYRPTIGFAANIAHAQHLTEAFRQAGIRSDWIAGTLPAAERQARLIAFHDGAIQVLWNAQILTEGYDEPRIACVILARPTQSPTLYAQMVGRGTRRIPGKTDCVVIDVVDMATRHALQDLGTLLGRDRPPHSEPAAKDSRPAAAPLPQSPDGVNAVLFWQADRIDLLTQSVFRWQAYGSQWVLPCDAQERLVLQPESATQWTLVRHTPASRDVLGERLTLEDAMAQAEDWTRTHPAPLARKTAAWLKDPATAKQRATAQALGIALDAHATKEDASNAISWALHHRR